MLKGECIIMYGNILNECDCGKGYWKEISSTGNQPSGYSLGKGILGAAVFGPIGAVAGIGGKKTKMVTYQCTGCGRTKTITYDKYGNYKR